MDVVYFIGNGFDLQAKLPTSPLDVRDKCLIHLSKEIEDSETSNSPSPALLALQQSLTVDYDDWGDFETALGDSLARSCSSVSVDPKCYSDAVAHFVEFLYSYIDELNGRISQYKLPRDLGATLGSKILQMMQDGMRDKQARRLRSTRQDHQDEHWNVHFVSFNYTTLLDKILRCLSDYNQLKSTVSTGRGRWNREIDPKALHVHGSITDGHGIITGVDNASQISVPAFRENEDIIDAIVKPRLNEEREDLVDESAAKLVEKSTIVCVFGMALGKTDATWWRILADWLIDGSGSRLLVINVWGNQSDITPRDNMRGNRAVVDRFCESAGIADPEQRKQIESWIVVSRNSSLFDLGIDLSEVQEAR